MQVPVKELEVDVPADVDVSVQDDVVTVRGPRGELSRRFKHPKLSLRVGPLSDGDGEEGFIVRVDRPRRKDEALAGTWASHVRNMIDGVTRGYEAEMRIVYSHFPIKAKVEGDRFLVQNFLGERHPRHARIQPGVEIEVQGDTVTLAGSDKEAVGQTAATIERITRIRGYDTRVFQDGIYIVQKPRPVEAEDDDEGEAEAEGEGGGAAEEEEA